MCIGVRVWDGVVDEGEAPLDAAAVKTKESYRLTP
jgi:hypothetical protein